MSVDVIKAWVEEGAKVLQTTSENNAPEAPKICPHLLAATEQGFEGIKARSVLGWRYDEWRKDKPKESRKYDNATKEGK